MSTGWSGEKEDNGGGCSFKSGLPQWPVLGGILVVWKVSCCFFTVQPLRIDSKVNNLASILDLLASLSRFSQIWPHLFRRDINERSAAGMCLKRQSLQNLPKK